MTTLGLVTGENPQIAAKSIALIFATESAAPWGLASISSRQKGAVDYVYDESGGQGMFNYLVDTGVRITHKEFSGGRAVWGYNAVNNQNTDNAGHGT